MLIDDASASRVMVSISGAARDGRATVKRRRRSRRAAQLLSAAPHWRCAHRQPHEGITLGNSMPVVYCQNDLGGAWERDQLGKWTNTCTPGGEAQRKDAFHLGINLILYAMTENYKDDLIHVPFIRKRLT
jgi:hypothetical protein